MGQREDILGTVLDGRYRVEAVLGGAHAGGTVFRGRDAAAGSNVVVRCPAIPTRLTGPALDEALEAFVAEAALLAKISQGSSDVERLLASGVADRVDGVRVPYTIFEWLAGRSLERHIAERAGGSSIGEALVILEPAARALAVAHAMGVAHRDVRPANLWLAERSGRTTLKVAAFGIATRVGPGDTAYAPEYGAPEHFKKSYGAIGPATDVYGLALCVIEMVTGKRALEGSDAGELYLATSDLARRPTLRARGSHVSDAVEAVLQRALAVDPKRRWASARELWDALVGAVPELTPAPASVRTRASERPPGLGGGSHPGVTPYVDSAPASVPPGLAELARAASTAPSSAVVADDRRLGDSIRASDALRGEREAREQQQREREGGDRSGTRAWLATAAIAVAIIGVIVAKVGAGAGPGAAAPKPTVSAPRSSASAVQPAEQAVRVTPFLADMVKVPAGTFTMGSDHDGKGEKPLHRVTLTHAFYIDRTEVRADAYASCVEDRACSSNKVHAGEVVDSTYGCNTDKERPKHPANCIDRMQAEQYCTFARKRLPTEAEWEYAARGTDAREYPWGNAAPTTCAQAILTGMVGECGDRKGTWEIGTTAEGKTPFGALDMAGNVWEWVADGYDAYPTVDAGGVIDPSLALQPSGKGVLRGGSWDYSVTSAKTTYRLPFAATSGNVSTGVRCARDAE
jgi:formylglycine-generating enzyme required for sulfatase activity/serine/threonine protein kinase